MTRKVLISESQLKMLKDHICETDNHDIMVRRVVVDLDLNYEPSQGTFKKGGEFHEEAMVLNKVNQELMTAKSLFDYLSYKYKLGEKFLKQIINDWYKGNLSNSSKLSKNISIA